MANKGSKFNINRLNPKCPFCDKKQLQKTTRYDRIEYYICPTCHDQTDFVPKRKFNIKNKGETKWKR